MTLFSNNFLNSNKKNLFKIVYVQGVDVVQKKLRVVVANYASYPTLRQLINRKQSRNLKLLVKRHIFCDGTIEIAPKPFYQVYSLHPLIEGRCYPNVHSFLPKKTQKIYKNFFTVVKDGLDGNVLKIGLVEYYKHDDKNKKWHEISMFSNHPLIYSLIDAFITKNRLTINPITRQAYGAS
ncbi:hypothetical protein BpHYR1_008885 [Brachionus plicatilis]|uniref:Uncharacterized protein n=1 Tax=Brachionus plicatilis TaxID=10195 RepID=A0A3M7R883_BRAPC|nr:hypothetical protein BpHYR1_008885 [Brachionus plicatilis]